MRASAPVRRAAAACGAVAAAALAGCTSFLAADVPQPTFYVWRDAGKSAPAAQRSPRSLLVAPTETVSFYDSQRIVFTRDPRTRDRYQFASWTDRPGRRFDLLLLERLEQRNAFARVAMSTSLTRGDLLLSVSILEMYHDDAPAPGFARLRVAAELSDRPSRTLIARRTFVQGERVAEENAGAAVEAFHVAVARILDELVAWVEAEAAQAGAR
jgi:cholesterol transport system auxiliary component